MEKPEEIMNDEADPQPRLETDISLPTSALISLLICRVQAAAIYKLRIRRHVCTVCINFSACPGPLPTQHQILLENLLVLNKSIQIDNSSPVLNKLAKSSS